MADHNLGINLADEYSTVEDRRQYRDSTGDLQTRSRSATVRLLIRAGDPVLEYVESHDEYPDPGDMNPREFRDMVRSAFRALEREEDRDG